MTELKKDEMITRLAEENNALYREIRELNHRIAVLEAENDELCSLIPEGELP